MSVTDTILDNLKGLSAKEKEDVLADMISALSHVVFTGVQKFNHENILDLIKAVSNKNISEDDFIDMWIEICEEEDKEYLSHPACCGIFVYILAELSNVFLDTLN